MKLLHHFYSDCPRLKSVDNLPWNMVHFSRCFVSVFMIPQGAGYHRKLQH